MKKFLYCDSCFLITCFQEKRLHLLSQYKSLFFVSKTQLDGELIKPFGISNAVRTAISIIEVDRDEILSKTIELGDKYTSLSFYDCLCMSYALLDGYCLVTDDKTLQKKCIDNNVEIKSSKEILNKLAERGDGNEEMKK